MTLSQIQPLSITHRFGISNVDKENPTLSKSVVQAHSISTTSSHLTNGRRRRARLAGFPSSPVIAAQNASLRSARSPITSVREAIEGRARLLAVPAGEDVKKYTRSKVVLPRRLPRPHFRDIDPSRLTAINADLADIPIEYLQDNLATVGPQLLSVLAGAVPDRPQSSLPKELPVLIQDNSFDMPTHVFAVHASGPFSKLQRKVTLFPAHNLVFAAHCAALPELPPSKPSQPEEPNTKITVPVVPLCIPSPAMFPTLQSYLYTKRSDLLLASLLPLPPHPDASSVKTALENLAKRLAGTFTLPALLERAQRVHGLWQNACALQIFDEKLFGTMEISWAVITNAMALATGQALGLPSQEDAMDTA